MKGRTPESKDVIFYARDYRHFAANTKNTVLFLVFCVLPVTLAFIFFYSPLTRAVSLWTGKVIMQVTGDAVEILSSPFLPGLGSVYYVSLIGTIPSYTHALIACILTIIAIPIASQAKTNARSFMIYVCMGLYVQLISCLFFLFWPELFPYTLSEYSELYMLQAASLWIIIPTLLGLALALMRASILHRVLAILIQVGTMLIFSTVRYVVYLCFLNFCSSLYMATLFFSFGVLFDFIQMVMIYSFLAKRISEQYDSLKGRSQWAWL